MDEQNHDQTKKKLKIIGGVLTGVGAVCALIGFINFFTQISSGVGGFPKLFFLCFIGLPTFGVGLMLLLLGFRKEISSYVKNESVPVINEAADELKPAIKSVVGAVKEGLNGERQNGHTVTCPKCGATNPAGHSFCPECGEPLVKTCPQCGARQEADDKFCGKCGAKFE